MKTILYATDYSESSIAALKYAYNMSLKINAKLLAVHVFDFPKTISSREEDISKELLTGHQTKLTDFCEEHLAWESDNAPVKTEVIVNPSIVHGIVEKAKEVQACLIITGMKGTSRLRTMIMGSTTRDLIENAPYPVLTIPKDISYKQIKTMVYASVSTPPTAYCRVASLFLVLFKNKIKDESTRKNVCFGGGVSSKRTISKIVL